MSLNIKPGIYQILNIFNGKFYIGSSQNISHRCGQHRYDLKNNRHRNQHLQRAWNKYGPKAFEFRLIQNCRIEDLIQCEQYWIDFYKPEYNICERAASTTGYKHTKESREKMRQFRTGRKLSLEAYQKTIDSIHSRACPIERIDPITGEVTEYNFIEDAVKAGFHRSGIQQALRGRYKHKGFLWNYLPREYNRERKPAKNYYRIKNPIIQRIQDRGSVFSRY